jgi:hypothetical protein
MEELIKSMAEKVNKEEAEGYLVSCCVKDDSGNYQIMSGARAAKRFTTPYHLYAGLLGKLFHTITQGHPEPQVLLQRVLDRAMEEFKETIRDESRSLGEFTIVGKL